MDVNACVMVKSGVSRIMTFDNIQHPFLITNPKKLGVEEVYLKITKAIYDKLIANITLNDERLKVFPLRSGRRQGHSLL